MYKKKKINDLLPEEEDEKMNLTASSGSEGSPSSAAMPNLEDLSLEKDVDKKTLKQELYDLKLRIYYMEKREKVLGGDDGDDIYQKYVEALTENEGLKRTLDERNEMLLKATKVTNYLRDGKEKLNFDFQQKEKFFKEHILQLEKELENIKLCNPKFGLHSTILMSGDTGDSFSFSSPKEHQRISDLEHQIDLMTMELDNMKSSNEQLEQTVTSLQRKINFCNKEISDLNGELITVRRERDLAIETSSKNSDLLIRVEKEKGKLESRLGKTDEENENVSSSLNLAESAVAEQSSQILGDKAAAAVIRQLLTENKQMNRQLRKLKEDQLFTYELCSGCPSCQKERKLKKASVLNLGHRSIPNTSEDDRSDTASQRTDSEPEQSYENLSKFKENAEIRALLKEKDKQIKQLRAECRKRNYNLQELVNKELWDKNREIEKLNKSCEKQKHEMESLKKQNERTSSHLVMREIQPFQIRTFSNEGKENILCQSDDVKMLREQLRTCLEEKKTLLNKINHLETKISSDDEQKALSALVHNLRLQVTKHRDDYEEADKARKEAFNACALLTNRLEELASFLESLLSHENVGLNSKKRELLMQAIERSREISKSFSSTFADPDNASILGTKFESSVDLSAPILPDYSEINLSFSCGDDDEEDEDEEAVNRTLKVTDEGNSVFNQMMRRSIHEFASTEDSDSYPVKKNVLFVNDLHASGELIFSANGVHRLNEQCPDSVESESEGWSGREPQVCVGLTSSGTKLRNRRWKPEPCYSTDSDTSARTSRKCVDVREKRLMQRRILHLERFNESLRKDLKYLRTRSEKKISVEKTDMEKLFEKSQLRSLLNKINLENCVDTDMYRTYVEIIANLESDLKEARNRILELETKNETETCNCNQLRESLENASQRVTELESFVAANDRTLEELEKCKKTVLKLTHENEKLLCDLDEVSKYKLQIEEYENQLVSYKKNCEKMELELFEKETMEKLYKEQCAKLEEEILEKTSIHNSLKLTKDELEESRIKVADLEAKVSQLNDLVREKENIILERDCHVLELNNEKESDTLRLNELKQKTELEIVEKLNTIQELSSLLKLSDDKTRKFEHEVGLLQSLLNTCEEEKREFRAKMEKQVVEYQTLKKQHEQKMQHLLAQIIAYRTEEESRLAAHHQLVERIQEAQQKKEVWKKSIADWREKYDLLKKEKDLMEEKLQCCTTRKLDTSFDSGTNKSSANMDKEVHHLQNIKSQLETRVRELESANKQLESRLQRLQTNKVFATDFDLTSDDSSRAGSPTSKKNFDFDYPTYKSGGTTTTGYSSSLPSSPSHVKCPASPLTSSVLSSPSIFKNENGLDLPNMWLTEEIGRPGQRNAIYGGELERKVEEKLRITPSRKGSSENSATSPDLGIESDNGRNSSFEFDTGNNDKKKIKTEIVKLEEENKTLKLELGQTRKELEETLDKLTMLNKNKRRMEKAIFQQVYETKHILQRAREHLEDGVSDSNAASA